MTTAGNETNGTLQSAKGEKMPQNGLIIDDAIALHELIKVVLQEQALEIHSAFDGESGLAFALRLRPDLVLLDIEMPKMDGLEVCKRLKADPSASGIPIIFLTASSSMQSVVAGFELQAVDYITKPFVAEVLAARVRVALRTKRLLDLVPGSIAGAQCETDSGAEPLNVRLSLAHLMRSRAKNPWNRKRVCDSAATAHRSQATDR